MGYSGVLGGDGLPVGVYGELLAAGHCQEGLCVRREAVVVGGSIDGALVQVPEAEAFFVELALLAAATSFALPFGDTASLDEAVA